MTKEYFINDNGTPEKQLLGIVNDYAIVDSDGYAVVDSEDYAVVDREIVSLLKVKGA